MSHVHCKLSVGDRNMADKYAADHEGQPDYRSHLEVGRLVYVRSRLGGKLHPKMEGPYTVAHLPNELKTVVVVERPEGERHYHV